MAESSEPNAASFFQHSHQISVVNSTFNMVAGDMDVAHNYSDQGSGHRRSSLLSQLLSRIGEFIPWSTESPTIVSQNNIELLDQLSSRRHYRIHSGKYEQRFVLVKVFQGTQAEKAVSSFASGRPFIVYNFAPSRGSVGSWLASVLAKDLSDILPLSCKIVSELAFGLDYLSSEGVQAGSNDDNNIEIFITDQDMLKIAPDFGPLRNSNTRCSSGQIDDSLWILFNKLCAKAMRQTFSEATYILHQDHRSRDTLARIDEVSATDTDTEVGDTQNLIHDNISTSNSSEPSVIYRRELLWRGSKHGSQSVAAIARRYRQLWEHLNLTVGQSYPSYGMPRKQAARPLRTIVHRCQGYRKEEITLTSDVSDNAIVSHFIPSLYERCLVCKEVVKEEEFRCACDGIGSADDGISPTIKCSVCRVWQHWSCIVVPRDNAQFICSSCGTTPAPENLSSNLHDYSDQQMQIEPDTKRSRMDSASSTPGRRIPIPSTPLSPISPVRPSLTDPSPISSMPPPISLMHPLTIPFRTQASQSPRPGQMNANAVNPHPNSNLNPNPAAAG
ncbi:hypothetical protein D9758_004123 [Tetrapyrgos nigripes]|uniref:Zinc finger PHD-type domain-containing protein n=1 Tax=Tetrapyrgos nigripes TaxID=182062 RepID=A0A8H5GTV4_9AGAR|nr:hypothetical protein D9758_004123 [Tetrapyrgos nigripes]